MTAGLRVAVRHLTVLPVPRSDREAAAPNAAALTWFPLVGLGVGACAAVALALPIPNLVGAALALAAWTSVTGALHEDAWMDCADAALAVVPRQKRLEILKDPHAGAHAVTALVLALLLRFSALTATSWLAPLAAAVCGRWTMAVTLAWFPPARPDGLGATFARGARLLPASVTAVLILALLTAGGSPRVAIASAVGTTCGIGLGAWLSRRFGGLTGDGYGAAGYGAETVVLLCMVPLR